MTMSGLRRLVAVSIAGLTTFACATSEDLNRITYDRSANDAGIHTSRDQVSAKARIGDDEGHDQLFFDDVTCLDPFLIVERPYDEQTDVYYEATC